MLEILDTIQKFLARLEVALPWAGPLVVSIIGGMAAFIKEWEDKAPARTVPQHVFALLRKLFFALVAGIMWYQIIIWQSMLGSPLSYLGATLVGLYATEFMDFLWAQMKQRFTAGQNKPGP